MQLALIANGSKPTNIRMSLSRQAEPVRKGLQLGLHYFWSQRRLSRLLSLELAACKILALLQASHARQNTHAGGAVFISRLVAALRPVQTRRDVLVPHVVTHSSGRVNTNVPQ